MNAVWLEGIPHFYALKNDVSLEEAKAAVKKEYEKVGRERLEWYDLRYWIDNFNLSTSPKELLTLFENRIKVYPEVSTVLDNLKRKGFRLIIVSNARREFVDLELDRIEIKNCFDRVFSSTSDFGLIKKTAQLYERVCNICGLLPEEVVHVGDDRCFDFYVPKKLGITAFYLDRTGKETGESVICNLRDLNNKIANLVK